jgi:hypothetical protein
MNENSKPTEPLKEVATLKTAETRRSQRFAEKSNWSRRGQTSLAGRFSARNPAQPIPSSGTDDTRRNAPLEPVAPVSGEGFLITSNRVLKRPATRVSSLRDARNIPTDNARPRWQPSPYIQISPRSSATSAPLR